MLTKQTAFSFAAYFSDSSYPQGFSEASLPAGHKSSLVANSADHLKGREGKMTIW